jgi:hypothetical protein
MATALKSNGTWILTAPSAAPAFSDCTAACTTGSFEVVATVEAGGVTAAAFAGSGW